MRETETEKPGSCTDEEWQSFVLASKKIFILQKAGYFNAYKTQEHVSFLLKLPLGLKVVQKFSKEIVEIVELANKAEKKSPHIWEEVEELNERLKTAIERVQTPTQKFSQEVVEAVQEPPQPPPPRKKTFRNLWGLLKKP